MRRFYINSNGRLKRQDNTIYLEFEQDGQTIKKAIPINDIDCFHIFGEVDLNTKVLNFLSQNEIMIFFYNYYGFYSGCFTPRKKIVSGNLNIEQSRFYLHEESRLYLAISFIDSAIFHIIRNLRKNDVDLSIIEEFEFEYNKLNNVKTISELMGLEGNIRNRYYKAFNNIIKNNDFFMDKRSKQPPENPINALISFGNSVLYNTILSEIYRTQLDPTISYLHSPSEKRFSLSLDLAEIFKPFIIDPIIFSLINQRVISKNDFEEDLNYSYLNENGRKKFLKYFEEKLETTIKHRKLNRKVSYKYLIRLECYKLIKHFISDDVYKPFKAWW